VTPRADLPRRARRTSAGGLRRITPNFQFTTSKKSWELEVGGWASFGNRDIVAIQRARIELREVGNRAAIPSRLRNAAQSSQLARIEVRAQFANQPDHV